MHLSTKNNANRTTVKNGHYIFFIAITFLFDAHKQYFIAKLRDNSFLSLIVTIKYERKLFYLL